MNTLVLVVSAFVGQPGEQVQPPNPAWQTDYIKAQKQASQTQKPMAVFLAPGENGISRLLQGGLSPQCKEVLVSKYIPVLIDTSTAEGKRWANSFQISDMGVVISDRGGQYQAFWRNGEVTNPMLMRQLQKYADQTNIIATEVSGRLTFYPPIDGSQGPGQYTYDRFGNPRYIYPSGNYQGQFRNYGGQPMYYNDMGEPIYNNQMNSGRRGLLRGGLFGRNRY